MPHHKPLPPDTRPDWRDPNLPVIREYRMANGTLLRNVDPEYEQRYRAHLLSTAAQRTYHTDPSYNWRRKR